jgi:SAM-dependent methyltransferase
MTHSSDTTVSPPSARDTEPIYRRPGDYDLEHEGDDEDIGFYRRLVERLRPRRVLELACGSGRVTLPLAELAASRGFEIVGVELAEEMLAAAVEKRGAASDAVQRVLTLTQGDMRTWRTDDPFDLVITPCSSLCHLLTLPDRLAAWRTAWLALSPGGRFVADIAMPNLATYADSFQTPPRALVEIDLDTSPPDGSARLVRYKTTRYLPHTQRAEVRFLYDRFTTADPVDRYVSDFESHVYFPCELELLFIHTGFDIEDTFGSYFDRPLRPTSREMLIVGRRP